MDFVSRTRRHSSEGMGIEGSSASAGAARQARDRLGRPRIGKVPSHAWSPSSTTPPLRTAARRAARELGYTRMWSIHPNQIRPIVEAFSPDEQQIDQASAILLAAAQADWAPISHGGVLHDRASYRCSGRCCNGRTRPDARCPPKWRHGSDTACVPSSAFPSFSRVTTV
jgi:citrate lyase subunit beta/citryl-CoA lyase